jgi:hypothetical protein
MIDSAICKTCKKSYPISEFYKTKKSKIGCCICKERDPRSLDFHHKDPEQKAGQVLEIRMRFGEEKAMEEISKCDVICANCHRKHHQNLQIYDSDIPILGDHI